MEEEGETPEFVVPKGTVEMLPEDAALLARQALGVTLASQFA
jgi:hypothetical protein